MFIKQKYINNILKTCKCIKLTSNDKYIMKHRFFDILMVVFNSFTTLV